MTSDFPSYTRVGKHQASYEWNSHSEIHTPEVYAIELFEFPKAIPMAKLSVAATPSISSIAMLQRLQLSFLYLNDSEVIRSNIISYFCG